MSICVNISAVKEAMLNVSRGLALFSGASLGVNSALDEVSWTGVNTRAPGPSVIVLMAVPVLLWRSYDVVTVTGIQLRSFGFNVPCT